MKLKKRNKFKKIIFICVLLILVLTIIIMSIEKNMQLKEEVNEEQLIIEQQIEDYFSDKICPTNSSSLYANYKGKNNKNDLYRNFKIFIDKLPEFVSDIKNKEESELLVYFEENKNNIYEYLGIENREEFLNLSRYIQTKSIDTNLFDYCEIEDKSFDVDTEGKYLTFDIKFVFKNNTDSLEFKVYFANFTKTKPQVKYNVTY